MLYFGAPLIVIGLLVMRAAEKANNDGAWVLYGFTPFALGLVLIAVSL